jgi:hypothetical protein
LAGTTARPSHQPSRVAAAIQSPHRSRGSAAPPASC